MDGSCPVHSSSSGSCTRSAINAASRIGAIGVLSCLGFKLRSYSMCASMYRWVIMNLLNLTANNSQCVLDCFQPPWNSYFDQHQYTSDWPISRTLLTMNLVGLLASVVFCGMNCSCPCTSSCCKKKAVPLTQIDESSPLVELDERPAPKGCSKVAIAARVFGAVALTGLQIGLSAWAFSWLGQHDQTSPLNIVEGMIEACYANCTG